MNTAAYWIPESIPAEERAELSKLYAVTDYPVWDWDLGTWRWELSLFTTDQDLNECIDIFCYVYIAPCQDGQPLPYGTVPELDHRGWMIGNICEDIYIPGALQQAKAVLDNLIQPTPEIPLHTWMSLQPEGPALSTEQFVALEPGDLFDTSPVWIVGEKPTDRSEANKWGRFLVEHTIRDYPGPFSCRIYCRRQGAKDHCNLVAFTPADQRGLEFFRRVRKPLPELRALISSIEKGAFEPDYDVARSVGISRGQVACLADMVKNCSPVIASLLDGTVALDHVLDLARDEGGQPIYRDGELVYAVIAGQPAPPL
jgi:hypothetical protein